jgi:hypothetical protein
MASTQATAQGLQPTPQQFLSPYGLMAQQSVQPSTGPLNAQQGTVQSGMQSPLSAPPSQQNSQTSMPQPVMQPPVTLTPQGVSPAPQVGMASSSLAQKIPQFLGQLTTLLTQGLQMAQQQGGGGMGGEFIGEQGQTHQFQITLTPATQSTLPWLQSQGLSPQTPLATITLQPPLQTPEGQTIQQIVLPLGHTTQGSALPLLIDAQGQATMPSSPEGFQTWLLPLLSTLSTPAQTLPHQGETNRFTGQPNEMPSTPETSSPQPTESGQVSTNSASNVMPSSSSVPVPNTSQAATSVPSSTQPVPALNQPPTREGNPTSMAPANTSQTVQQSVPSAPVSIPPDVSASNNKTAMPPTSTRTESSSSLPPATIPAGYQVIFPAEPTPYGINPERRIPAQATTQTAQRASHVAPASSTNKPNQATSQPTIDNQTEASSKATTPPPSTEAITLTLPDGSGEITARKAPDEKEALFTAEHPKTKEPLFFTLKQEGNEQVAVSLKPTSIKDLDDALSTQADPVARKQYRQTIRNESGKLMSRFIQPQEHLGLWAYPVMQWARVKIGPLDLASDSARVKEYLETGKALDKGQKNTHITPSMERDFLRINKERTYRGGASPLYISDIYTGLQTVVKTKQYLELAQSLPTSRHLPSPKTRQKFQATLDGFKPNADNLDAEQRWGAFKTLITDTKAVDDAVGAKPPKLEDVLNRYVPNANGMPDPQKPVKPKTEAPNRANTANTSAPSSATPTNGKPASEKTTNTQKATVPSGASTSKPATALRASGGIPKASTSHTTPKGHLGLKGGNETVHKKRPDDLRHLL